MVKKRKEPKKMGRPTIRTGKKLTETIGMTCTKEELEVLKEAVELSERDNISAYARSVLIPAARAAVANKNLHSFTAMIMNQSIMKEYFRNMMQDEIDDLAKCAQVAINGEASANEASADEASADKASADKASAEKDLIGGMLSEQMTLIMNTILQDGKLPTDEEFEAEGIRLAQSALEQEFLCKLENAFPDTSYIHEDLEKLAKTLAEKEMARRVDRARRNTIRDDEESLS